MNVTFMLKKTPIVFLFLCLVILFSLAEASRSIRLKRVKTHIAPRHISLLARSGNGMYARTFAYGRPIPSYSTNGKIGNNRRYHAGRRRNGKRENLSRTYASKYLNWSPNTLFGGRKNPRADRLSQPKKRKEPFPFLMEPPFGANKQKRRIRPQRFNVMQRPKPPKKPNEFDDEYFFPEEAKRAETKYEFESRYQRPKKKRRPEFESNYNKPEFVSKYSYFDDKPGYRTKPREPPFSYSSFVQHPSGLSDEQEDFYEDTDSVYSQPVVRNKKKRVKKKSNSRKKNKDQFKPFVFENDPISESYPPYTNADEYELPTKSYKKRNKPSFENSDDDEFLPSKTSYSKPQVNSLFNTDSNYRGSQNTHQVQYNPSYSQSWSSPIETTVRPLQYQTENGFQPQQYVPNQYRDYSNLLKTKSTATNTQQPTYYSQPDNSYKNIAYSNNYSTQSQTPTNYNSYSTQVLPSYSQPVPQSSPVLSDITIQKSVPIYDNTETFYNFNNNAYVNSQSSKYYESDNGQKYGARLPTSATSYKNKPGEKIDSDSDFIKKHQNLYNNGLSGVPVQGDGFAKENTKKDYDIGYGDFQFDENPTN